MWYKNGTDNGLNNPYMIGAAAIKSAQNIWDCPGLAYHYDSVNGQGILPYLIMVRPARGTSLTQPPETGC